MNARAIDPLADLTAAIDELPTAPWIAPTVGRLRAALERVAAEIGDAAEVRQQRDEAQERYARVRTALGDAATNEPLWEQVARLVGGARTGPATPSDLDWPTPDCQLGKPSDPGNQQWVAKVLDAKRTLGRFLDNSPLAGQVGREVRAAIVTLGSDVNVRYSRKYPTPPDYERGYIDGAAKVISEARGRESHSTLSRLASAAGVALDPGDEDPVGTVEAAVRKARDVASMEGYKDGFEHARSVDVRFDRWVDSGQRVRAFAAWSHESTHGYGHVKAHSRGPQVLIERDSGATFWWRVDLCETAEPPAAPLAVGDEVTTREQLETLPVGTALRDTQADLVKVGSATGQGPQLWAAGDSEPLHWRAVLPARVVDLPDSGVGVGTGGDTDA